ncbi:MAG TPA: hypothetical protein VGV92_07110 [Gammaproteobacteria bacterium]|nr:hypothetical protein [Gammaproteobacteria bacterium]
MKEAWNELMQVYTEILQSQEPFDMGINVSQSQKEAVTDALEKLLPYCMPDDQLGSKVRLLAEQEGGLPSNEISEVSGLLVKLKKLLPNDDRYDQMEHLLERSLYFASKNPVLVDQEMSTKAAKKQASYDAHARQYQAEQAAKNVAAQAPAQPGLFGRLMNATVNSVVNLFVSKPAEPTPQGTTTAQDSVVEEPKGPPTQAQLEGAWKRLMKTYATFAEYNQKIGEARHNLVAAFFDKETAKKVLTVELSSFQKMVSHLNEYELQKKIRSLVQVKSLDKGDYADIFVSLRGCLPHGELRELFVDTFEPAALAWKQQEKRDAGLAEAWQHLMSVYKVVAGNVNDAGSIRLLCIELSVFKDLVEKNVGAEKLEDKVVELMKTSGSPIKMSSETKDELLGKVAREPDGHKLLGLLELTLQTPLKEPRKGLETKNTDQDRFSH